MHVLCKKLWIFCRTFNRITSSINLGDKLGKHQAGRSGFNILKDVINKNHPNDQVIVDNRKGVSTHSSPGNACENLSCISQTEAKT